ncbi:MAG: SDR family oxidoreductase, partial [Desulfobacterales bacterium]|nr:SDR family oxidoreductase [Desulfobacterales bacterium]
MNANQTGPPDDQGFNPFREDLRGRCGIITGAASGIGRATAFYLARCGANLVLSDVNTAALQSAAGEIEALGVKAPLALEVDVTREKQVARLVEETVTGLGRIDFLVTSAGILRRTPFLSMTSEEWDLVLGINLRGVFLCCRVVAAVMAGQKQGVIVNVASLAGRSS